MRIIIGLGNPGAEYAGTRHNIGFEVVDKLKAEWNFPDFEFNKKFAAEISEKIYMIHDTKYKILLAKPQTFMNLSGESVQAILDFYKLTPDDILVIHDDLDITIGNYKISTGASSAGHNGVESIIEKIGTQAFTRVRVGVEMAAGRQARQVPGEAFVLQKFSDEERKKIAAIELTILEEIKKLL